MTAESRAPGAESMHHARAQGSPTPQHAGPSYRADEEVDFIVVGSGAAGGVVAKELATAGHRVVMLEAGPWRDVQDFSHDEIKVFQQGLYTNDFSKLPQSFRKTEKEEAKARPALLYARGVGGTSLHYSANFWRFKPIDFKEASIKGPLAGTGVTDWPITYEELEPYYTKVDWEIGVAGAPGPFDPPRSRPYPMPPHPPKSTGMLIERGAKKMGWTAFPAPMSIASRPYDGRGQCVQCGLCLGFACEVRAKGSTLFNVIPKAVATGKCEVRPNSYVRKVEINKAGLVVGVKYFDGQKREVFQRAKAVVVCANGAETPKLLLNSKSTLFPDGLANSSGAVGKYMMFNGAGNSNGIFEHEVNGYKGIVATRIIWDLYELDPKLGLYGGGGFDFRFDATPMGFAFGYLPPDAPRWGSAFKKTLVRDYNRSLLAYGHTSSLPVETNNVSIDPKLKDAWGVPALRLTYVDHPQDLKLMRYFADKGKQLLEAAGATRAWSHDITSQEFSVHLLGTARMGNDKRTSVVDKNNRAPDVPNLFLVDGSSLVSCGRGQPTMTIQALAFRAGEYIANAAKRGEIARRA